MPDTPEQEEPKKEAKPDKSYAHFFSRQATSLWLQLELKGSHGKEEQFVAKFENSSYIVDLKDVRGNTIAKAIRNHPRYGTTVLELQKADDDSEIGRLTNLLKDIHQMTEAVPQQEAANKMLAMFTLQELREYDIDPFTTDLDLLMAHVLRYKSVKTAAPNKKEEKKDA